MKKILGVTLIIVGVLLGIFIGTWLLFIGGIVQTIDAVRATPTQSLEVGIGILRAVVGAPIGFGIIYVCTFFGLFLIQR